jgi:hypothetical protein
MSKCRLNVAIGAFALITAAHLVFPVHDFAQDRSVQITITDTGFIPGKMTAVINQQFKIHVVNKGHKVHQFSIPYYRIYTRDLNPGQSSDIAFSPWTAGRFDFTSDPSGSDNPEFRGNLVVILHE